MSARIEIVAIPRGELSVAPSRALSLAWGLATGERPWVSAETPWDLPKVPEWLTSLVEIPAAVERIAADGRWDGDAPDPETGARRERDHHRPDISVGAGVLTWRPLELGGVSGRVAGAREIEIESRPSPDRWIVRWDTGGRPSRFVGRCLLAALGSPHEIASLRGGWAEQLQTRPSEHEWWALDPSILAGVLS